MAPAQPCSAACCASTHARRGGNGFGLSGILRPVYVGCTEMGLDGYRSCFIPFRAPGALSPKVAPNGPSPSGTMGARGTPDNPSDLSLHGAKRRRWAPAMLQSQTHRAARICRRLEAGGLSGCAKVNGGYERGPTWGKARTGPQRPR